MKDGKKPAEKKPSFMDKLKPKKKDEKSKDDKKDQGKPEDRHDKPLKSKPSTLADKKNLKDKIKVILVKFGLIKRPKPDAPSPPAKDAPSKDIPPCKDAPFKDPSADKPPAKVRSADSDLPSPRSLSVGGTSIRPRAPSIETQAPVSKPHRGRSPARKASSVQSISSSRRSVIVAPAYGPRVPPTGVPPSAIYAANRASCFKHPSHRSSISTDVLHDRSRGP